MTATRLFLVDVEATAATPFSGVMTEFGVVDFASRSWFHGRLWPATPDPDIPAKPVVAPGARPAPAVGLGAVTTVGARPPRGLRRPEDVMVELGKWLQQWPGRPVLVSDNPAYDFMWVADAFDRAGMTNPFGHSGRRIGDLAAGLSGNWRKTSSWKSLRRTVHDHNPVNDALGNAEALAALLERHDQAV